MRTFAIICLVLACVSGCQKTPTADNSKIQSPNDQPIADPKPIGAGKSATLGNGKSENAGATGGKTVPKIEIKNAK